MFLKKDLKFFFYNKAPTIPTDSCLAPNDFRLRRLQ